LIVQSSSLVKLDSDNEILWSYDAGQQILSPILYGTFGMSYLHTIDTAHVVFNDGTLAFKATLPTTISGIDVMSQGDVYISGLDGKLYKYGFNGLKQWEYDATEPILFSPLITQDERIHFVTQGGTIYCVDKNGSLIWSYSANATPANALAIDAQYRIYTSFTNGWVLVLDKNGSPVYDQLFTGPVSYTPLITSNKVYWFSQYETYVLDKSGNSIQSAIHDLTLKQSPLYLGDERFLLAHQDGRISILDNLAVIWTSHESLFDSKIKMDINTVYGLKQNTYVSFNIPSARQATEWPYSDNRRLQYPPIKTYTDKHGIEFVWIEPNKFHTSWNGPVQRELFDGYWIAKTELTQEQYKSMTGVPVTTITTPNMAVSYVYRGSVDPEHVRMSPGLTGMYTYLFDRLTAKTYHLPTMDQMEYAVRAGTNSLYHFGNTTADISSYSDFLTPTDNPLGIVKRKLPNRFGLYDTVGNLVESTKAPWTNWETSKRLGSLQAIWEDHFGFHGIRNVTDTSNLLRDMTGLRFTITTTPQLDIATLPNGDLKVDWIGNHPSFHYTLYHSEEPLCPKTSANVYDWATAPLVLSNISKGRNHYFRLVFHSDYGTDYETELTDAYAGVEGTHWKTNSIGMRFVWIEPNTFSTGVSPNTSWYKNYLAPREVSITQGFWIADTPVTNMQYEAVTGNDPEDNSSYYYYPTGFGSTVDAKDFISQLNTLENTTIYRLPTNMEWELAARAKTHTRYFYGDKQSDFHLFGGFTCGTLEPVAMKLANQFGLYDVISKRNEAVQDYHPGNLKGMMGGQRYIIESPQLPLTDPLRITKGTNSFITMLRGIPINHEDFISYETMADREGTSHDAYSIRLVMSSNGSENFTTPTTPIELKAYSRNNNVLFKWDKNRLASSYKLYLSQNPDLSAFSVITTTSTSYTHPASAAYACVSAVNYLGESNCSPVSFGQPFSPPLGENYVDPFGIQYVWIQPNDAIVGTDEYVDFEVSETIRRVRFDDGYYIAKYPLSEEKVLEITKYLKSSLQYKRSDSKYAATLNFNELFKNSDSFFNQLNASVGCSSRVTSIYSHLGVTDTFGCYQLPTDGEWDYALSAGTENQKYFWGNSTVYRDDYFYHPNELDNPLGVKLCNQWGVCDVNTVAEGVIHNGFPPYEVSQYFVFTDSIGLLDYDYLKITDRRNNYNHGISPFGPPHDPFKGFGVRTIIRFPSTETYNPVTSSVTNLSVVSRTLDSVTLTWDKHPDEVGYFVFASSTDPSVETTSWAGFTGETMITVSGFGDQTHYFTVRPRNIIGYGPKSNIVSVNFPDHDPYESNNLITSAANLNVSSRTLSAANLTLEGTDWYRIDLPGRTEMNATVSYSPGTTIAVDLTDESESSIFVTSYYTGYSQTYAENLDWEQTKSVYLKVSTTYSGVLTYDLNISINQMANTTGETRNIPFIGEFSWIPQGTNNLSVNGGQPTTFTTGFWMATKEITQSQWTTVMGANSISWTTGMATGSNIAVSNITIEEAQDFISRLNTLYETDAYAIPTSSEWEYSARGGTTSEFYFGTTSASIDSHAWFADNSSGFTKTVAQKQKNPWSLFDVHGNTTELSVTSVALVTSIVKSQVLSGVIASRFYELNGTMQIAFVESGTISRSVSSEYHTFTMTNTFLDGWLNTIGASDVEVISFLGNTFMVVANSGKDSDPNYSSQIYLHDGNQFVFEAPLLTKWCQSVESFQIGTNYYFAVANRTNGVSNQINSEIFIWNGASFVSDATVPTIGAADWEHFQIGTKHYLALANSGTTTMDCVSSFLYSFDGINITTEQSFATCGAMDVEFTEFDDKKLLIYANQRDAMDYRQSVDIYSWNTATQQFASMQTIDTTGAVDAEAFEVSGERYLAISQSGTSTDSHYPVKLYSWNGTQYVFEQNLPVNGAHDVDAFVDDNKAYLSVSVPYSMTASVPDFNVNSFIFELKHDFGAVHVMGGDFMDEAASLGFSSVTTMDATTTDAGVGFRIMRIKD
jgi:formylglycine-generating enzyme required for sulfatase activity